MAPPPPEKSHPPFPSNPPLKVKVLSSIPLFENLVADSTSPPPPLAERRGCTLCLKGFKKHQKYNYQPILESPSPNLGRQFFQNFDYGIS